MRHYPLSEEQSEMFMEWKRNPNMTQYNMAMLFHFVDKKFTFEMFQHAVDEMLAHNPYLYTRFVRVDECEVKPQKYYDDPTLLIRQYPEMRQSIEISHYQMSEEEVAEFVNMPTRPFDPFQEPMVRFGFIELPARNAYMLDIFHLLMDGTSIKAINEFIVHSISGEAIANQGMKPYERAEQLYEALNTDRYLEEKQYYEEKLRDFNGFTDFCRQVDEGQEWGNSLKSSFILPQVDIRDWCVRKKLTPPDFTMAAYAKALSLMTGEQTLWFYTCNHRRSKADKEERLLGCYIKPMVLKISIDKEDNLVTLSKKMRSELFSAMRRNIYPMTHFFREHQLVDYGTEVLYNAEYMKLGSFYPGHPFYSYQQWFNFGLTCNHICCTVWERDSNYEFEVVCSDSLYSQEQIDRFMTIYHQVILNALQS